MNDSSLPADAERVLQATLSTWRELLSIETLNPDEDLRARGANSLMFMIAFVRSNDEFHIELPLAELFRAATARQFAHTVHAALGSTSSSSTCFV